jgi:FkbM family methyltransferase
MLKKIMKYFWCYYYYRLALSSCGLKLDYALNREGLSVLKTVFIDREYSTYFPFLEEATILDVGSHYGYFSIFASKNTDPASKIYAFEPSRRNFEILIQNLQDNGIRNVFAINRGISDKNEILKLFLKENFSNTICRANDISLPYENAEFINIDKVIGDYNINNIDFLKMDIEGAEFEALYNISSDTLAKITTISLEFHDMEKKKYTGLRLKRHLENCGFEIAKFAYSSTRNNRNFGKIIATKI